MDTEKLRKVLLDLNEINNDRIEGYETAAKETQDQSLKTLFREMASHSQNFNREISGELRNMGVGPTSDTTQSGKVFRTWMDLKASLTTDDRKTVLNSCETGEDAALKAYRAALQVDEGLTGSVRTTIERQSKQLQQDHDRIRNLRDAIA